MYYPRRLESSSVFTARAFSQARRNATAEIFAKGFPYSKKLCAHRSCINALAFSSGDGRFLASGGDDFRIHLWDFHQENVDSPSWTVVGPHGNVFAIAWSSSNRFLYSGGTDEKILKYDMTHMPSHILNPANPGSPVETKRDHNGSIRGLSGHPTQDEVFLSGSEDGRVIIHDGRVGSGMSRAQGTLQLTSEITGVQFHPVMENIFVTSDGHGCVCLRDTRMAFGPLSQRTQEGVVQTYNTKLSKNPFGYLSNPESSSITFDREGSRLAVTLLHYCPTIYSISDPHPLAICNGRNLPCGEVVPPGQRTYSNSCTIKHGSFGGPGLEDDDYYCAGSDDFRAYVWKIPGLSELTEMRKEISADDWPSQEFPNVIGFAEGMWKPRYVPAQLSTPLCRLAGHESIVNSTLIHPHFPHIVTSGVERDIIVHSSTTSSPCLQDLTATATDVRPIPDASPENWTRFPQPRYLTMNEDNEDSQMQTIETFDHFLRIEGEGDVFSIRRWNLQADADSDSELELDEML